VGETIEFLCWFSLWTFYPQSVISQNCEIVVHPNCTVKHDDLVTSVIDPRESEYIRFQNHNVLLKITFLSVAENYFLVGPKIFFVFVSPKMFFPCLSVQKWFFVLKFWMKCWKEKGRKSLHKIRMFLLYFVVLSIFENCSTIMYELFYRNSLQSIIKLIDIL